MSNIKIKKTTKNKVKLKKLSTWEWTLIWSSMRYFMGRQTISSAMWPHDFLKNVWSKSILTKEQIYSLHRDLKEHYDDFGKFGNKEIDSPMWEKLTILLSGKRYLVTAEGPNIPSQDIICIKHNNLYISVEGFTSSNVNQWVHEPYIKKIIEL